MDNVKMTAEEAALLAKIREQLALQARRIAIYPSLHGGRRPL
jgi:hypothetical protein